MAELLRKVKRGGKTARRFEQIAEKAKRNNAQLQSGGVERERNLTTGFTIRNNRRD